MLSYKYKIIYQRNSGVENAETIIISICIAQIFHIDHLFDLHNSVIMQLMLQPGLREIKVTCPLLHSSNEH